MTSFKQPKWCSWRGTPASSETLPSTDIVRNYSYLNRSITGREWDACAMRLKHLNSACQIFTWWVIWRVMSRVRRESRAGHSQFTSPYRLTRSFWCYPMLKHINLLLLAPKEHSIYWKQSRYPAGHLVDIGIHVQDNWTELSNKIKDKSPQKTEDKYKIIFWL